MAVKKVSLETLSGIFKTAIENKMNSLPVVHRRPVEEIQSLNQFRIINSQGIIGVIPIGGDLTDPENPDAIIQKHNVMMGVVIGMFPVLDHPKPFTYVEYVLEATSGIYLENNRPERRTFPVKWEPMEERWENNEWWYRVLVNCPVDSYEDRFEEQLL